VMTTTTRMAMFVPIASAAHGACTGPVRSSGRSSDRSRGLHPTVDQSIARVASVGRESNLMSVREGAFRSTDDPGQRGADISRTCPGPGTVYLGRTFESPELVFVRSPEVDAGSALVGAPADRLWPVFGVIESDFMPPPPGASPYGSLSWSPDGSHLPFSAAPTKDCPARFGQVDCPATFRAPSGVRITTGIVLVVFL